MNFTSELDILLDIDKRLRSVAIDYMLTGSFAMNYYAEPRMTRDIDIVIEVGDHSVHDLYKAFKDDYYVTMVNIEEALEFRTMFNVIHQKSVIKIDLIVRKDDILSVQAFQRKRQIRLNDSCINIISKEDLILFKLKWSEESKSALQQRDIINLLESGFDKEILISGLRISGLLSYAKGFIGERYFS